MNRGRQYIGAIVAGFAISFGLLAVVGLINSRYASASAVPQCTASMPFGWLAPVLAVGVVGVTGWLLAGTCQRRGGGPGDGMHASCPRCSETVVRDWRLCPYCGAELDGATFSGGAEPPGATTDHPS